jgi:hypothetical protein
MSRLKLNLQKSELLVTTDRQGKTHRLAALIHCQASQFPITHLGLPLYDKRFSKESFYGLIHQEEKRLSRWKADTLSIGGRLVLLNSVLSSQPIYYMSVFFLPKRVISRLDKIRRRFLWHGHKESQGQSRPVHLVNWPVAIRNKELGGLGIRDLEKTNCALMFKWMWQWVQNSQDWWKEATHTLDDHIRP